MWSVLPIKDFGSAKNRLRDFLSETERRELFRAMIRDVLAALAGVAELDGTIVVSRDTDAAHLAKAHGARLLTEKENRGQNAAVEAAVARLSSDGAAGMIALPGDVPLASSSEIRQVLAAHASRPSVTLVPARDGRGTNCVVCSPPDALPLSFGEDSFARHLDTAHGLGIAPNILKLPGLGLDIDTVADLRALLDQPAASATHAYLAESGIAARLRVEISALMELSA